MNRFFYYLLIVSATFLLGLIEAQAQTGKQTSFGMETDIKRKYRIPRAVIAQIVKNEELYSTEDINRLAEKLEGSLVNLNRDRQPDLFIQGDNGANITGFWLFRNMGSKWKMVLYSRAAWLDIKRTLTKGFYDVEIHAASAVTMWGSVYKFDGVKYVPRGCWESDMQQRRQKKNYYRCSGSSKKPYV